MDCFEKLKGRARQNEKIKNYLDSFSSQLGTEIFRVRLKKKLSQKELAALAGVTQTTISRIEAGDPGIKAETYEKVIRSLNISVTFSFKEEQSVSSESAPFNVI